jgi:hypothetical protein
MCLSVLVEFMTILGAYKEDVVLIGGWVPYFLFEEDKQEHTGSLDIDVALDFGHIDPEGYKSILQLLKGRGYTEGTQPFIYHRTVKADDGREMTVDLNFLAGEYGGMEKSRRTQKVQDIRARKARGCDVAFEHTILINLKRTMPDKVVNEVNMKVAGVVPFLVMKGMALWDRYKEKDAYDIYFTVQHYPEGVDGLVNAFEPHVSNALIQEGLAKIKDKFKTIDSPGPVWVVNFLEVDDFEEKERIRRDVFERVNALLDRIGIRPYSAE